MSKFLHLDNNSYHNIYIKNEKINNTSNSIHDSDHHKQNTIIPIINSKKTDDNGIFEEKTEKNHTKKKSKKSSKHSKKRSRHENDNDNNHNHSSSSDDDNHKSNKSIDHIDHLEVLRKKRLEREKTEKKRADMLLAKIDIYGQK